jgi:hypothetical protein
MVVLGFAAIVFPVIASGTARRLGAADHRWRTLVRSFSIHGTGPFFAALLLGLLSIVGGVFLFFNPLAGAVALTTHGGRDLHVREGIFRAKSQGEFSRPPANFPPRAPIS